MFKVRATTALKDSVKLLEWSPVDELIAAAFEDGSVSVHRTAWTRVWKTDNDQSVTALCWSADGQYLMVGFADFCIKCLDRETGKLNFAMKLEGTEEGKGIVAMDWSNRAASTPLYLQRDISFHPCPAKEIPRHPVTPDAFYEQLEGLGIQSTEEKRVDPDRGSLLCVADTTGRVLLILSAKVQIAEFNAAQLASSKNMDLETIRVATMHEFSTIALLQLSAGSVSDQLNRKGSTLLLTICNCDEIGKNFETIERCTEQISAILSDLEEAAVYLNEMKQLWSVVLNDFHRMMTHDEVPQHKLIYELGIFVTLYAHTENMDKMLEKHWTPLWLQKAERSIDDAMHGVNDRINQQFRIKIQNALVLATDLKGFLESLKITQNTTLGLAGLEFKQMEEKLMWILNRTDMLVTRMDEVSRGYRLFLCLLGFYIDTAGRYDLQNNTVDSNAENLCQFIENQLLHDTLMVEFQRGGPVGEYSKIFEDSRNSVSMEIAAIVLGELPAEEGKLGLASQVGITIDHVKSCLATIKQHLSNTITGVQQVVLCDGQVKLPLRLGLDQYVDEEGCERFLFLFHCYGGYFRSGTEEALAVVRGRVTRPEREPNLDLEGCVINVPFDVSMVDMASYMGTNLLVVYKRNGDPDICLLKHISTSHLAFGKSEARKFADYVSELIEKNKEYLVDLEGIYGNLAVHQHSGTTAPFAVSKNGLVAVVFSQRITIYDAIADDAETIP